MIQRKDLMLNLQTPRTQYLLAMSHAHVRIYLYRPFLHYLAKSGDIDDHNKPSNTTSFSPYANTCVQACHNILRLGADMCKQGLLEGSNWAATQIIFTAVLAMLYVLLDSNLWDGAEEAFRSFALGRTVISCLAQYNGAAERGQRILTVSCEPLSLPYLPFSNRRARKRS
jgi:hypothetical protein